ncbi:hypothetical protein OUZ56_033171 [Daphnia magna]|uniref:Uncharacterized protein n=1 Tax=Daphnia magna TaxID=35525 RepID=A0ABR0BAD8_9CRUS|nr:hypothetical protein OUZ56_033171 [Daphnia magna]
MPTDTSAGRAASLAAFVRRLHRQQGERPVPQSARRPSPERGEESVQSARGHLQERRFLGLRPRAVDNDQRDRPLRRSVRQVDRAFSRIEQCRGTFGVVKQLLKYRRLFPVKPYMQLRVRQAKGGHTRRAYWHVALPRMLEENDLCLRRNRADFTAVTNRGRAPAGGADRAIDRLFGRHHGRPT